MSGWVKLDTNIFEHPKFLGLDAESLRVWLRILTWSGQWATDGHITTAQLAALFGAPPNLDELCSRGLLDITDNGVCIHDWADHQTTAAARKATRENARKRVEKHRARNDTNAVTHPVTRYTSVTAQDGNASRNMQVTRLEDRNIEDRNTLTIKREHIEAAQAIAAKLCESGFDARGNRITNPGAYIRSVRQELLQTDGPRIIEMVARLGSTEEVLAEWFPPDRSPPQPSPEDLEQRARVEVWNGLSDELRGDLLNEAEASLTEKERRRLDGRGCREKVITGRAMELANAGSD